MSRYKGILLIELLVAISVLGIILTGIVTGANAITKNFQNPVFTQQAIWLAKSYVQAIQTKQYTATCTSHNKQRDAYSEVCDYHGLTEKPHDFAGNPIADLQDYTVAIKVAESEKNSLIITATVTHAKTTPITINGYKFA